jgi:hypothetical protein
MIHPIAFSIAILTSDSVLRVVFAVSSTLPPHMRPPSVRNRYHAPRTDLDVVIVLVGSQAISASRARADIPGKQTQSLTMEFFPARSVHLMLGGYRQGQNIGSPDFASGFEPSLLRPFSYGLNSILLVGRGNKGPNNICTSLVDSMPCSLL